ncbi:GNAT family N-acetyltransferase [Dyella sp. 2RAB6]|uniref:GNAT family N-acetyltransferase n=1 Tax=Dyella sp. 2RAB6 TaxID=3232992 RepID=UPI003F8DED72
MLLNNASLVVDDRVVLGPGEPWDIFFFVGEIVAGAREGHFACASMSHAMRKHGLACAKAILASRLPWRRSAGSRFVVARKGGEVLGAMLLRDEKLEDGTPSLLLEYLVVAASARRAGVGRLLVDYALRRAPVGGVECFCTDFSRSMQRLLKRQGFVRTHRAKEIQVNADSRIAMPARFFWKP